MKSKNNGKKVKKSKRPLPRLSEAAYKELKHLFEYQNDKDSFDEDPIEMLEYLLATIRESYEAQPNYLGGVLNSVLPDAFCPQYVAGRRREKAERLQKKVA